MLPPPASSKPFLLAPRTRKTATCSGLLALLASISATSPAQAQAQRQTQEEQPLQEESETKEPQQDSVESSPSPSKRAPSYRQSLDAALTLKKRSTAQVDAVVAQDLSDFPQPNLADSLERLPGVSVTRTHGEGSTLGLRGVSPLRLRTRINGMETRAIVGGNLSRSFNYNLFPAELFKSAVLNKTASPRLTDGSLGAVVDLNTPRPLQFAEGTTFAARAEGGYNDLSSALFPRAAALVAYRDPEGAWGLSAAAAYSRIRLDSARVDTYGWQAAPFGSVDGTPCAANPDDFDFRPDLTCQETGDAFHPRIPALTYRQVHGHRLGATAGLQFAPSDGFELRVDALYALDTRESQESSLQTLIRSNERNLDVTGPQLERLPARERPFPDGGPAETFGNNTLSGLSLSNATVFSGAERQETSSDFTQLTVALDTDLSESFSANLLAGISRSQADTPQATRVDSIARNYNGYSYDFSDDTQPVLAFNDPGKPLGDASSFGVTDLLDAQRTTNAGRETLEAHLKWSALDELQLSFGGDYRRQSFSTTRSSKSGNACELSPAHCDSTGDGLADLSGAPGQSGLSEEVAYNGPAGAGSTTNWAAPSVNGWSDELGLDDVPLSEPLERSVVENIIGAYLQASGELGLGSMLLQYNGGTRVVRTSQTSTAGDVERQRDPYTDVLPSANLALWLHERVVARLSGARVLSRPDLSFLDPSASIDGFNYSVVAQNPNIDPYRAWSWSAALEWYFAKESMLGLAAFSTSIDALPYILATNDGFFEDAQIPVSEIPDSPAASDPNGCGNVNPDGSPSGCWNIRRPLMGEETVSLSGLELSYQAPFGSLSQALPTFVRDMGLIATYSFTTAQQEYTFRGEQLEERPLNLSSHAYSSTLYYDDSTFHVRLGVNGRSQYLASGPDRYQNLWEYVEPQLRVNAAASYNVSDNIQVTLEGLNLTNTPLDSKLDVDAARRMRYGHTGRVFLLGARYAL